MEYARQDEFKKTYPDLGSMLMVDVFKHADIELESEVLILIYLQEGLVG